MPDSISLTTAPAVVIPARSTCGTCAAGSDGAATPKSAALSAPNPRLSYDNGVEMVVIQFRNSAGETVESIPTARELSAYRRAVLTGGQAPGGPQASTTHATA